MRTSKKKIVVFDLDETLGEFVELSVFCDAIESYNKKKLSFREFYEILDIFPDFFRPKLNKLLLYIKNKKLKGECNKIIIYTNNQGPKEWTNNIKKYLEKKNNNKIFDLVIAAYKINGKIIELGRTTHNKTVNDLLKCSNMPENTQICFLDDLYHPLMDTDDVYYIQVKPYNYSMPFNDMAIKYYDKYSYKISNKEKFITFVVNIMNKSNISDYNVKYKIPKISDIKYSNYLYQHVRNFFKQDKRLKTRKKAKINVKRKKINRTLKIIK